MYIVGQTLQYGIRPWLVWNVVLQQQYLRLRLQVANHTDRLAVVPCWILAARLPIINHHNNALVHQMRNLRGDNANLWDACVDGDKINETTIFVYGLAGITFLQGTTVRSPIAFRNRHNFAFGFIHHLHHHLIVVNRTIDASQTINHHVSAATTIVVCSLHFTKRIASVSSNRHKLAAKYALSIAFEFALYATRTPMRLILDTTAVALFATTTTTTIVVIIDNKRQRILQIAQVQREQGLHQHINLECFRSQTLHHFHFFR
mmetsp:Transcript_27590/g.45450  ORF Transcript_27590/g.45450 Transcript_27590/m.45450 type:complete len:261 (-) Transcript_27590:528-1310(-)